MLFLGNGSSNTSSTLMNPWNATRLGGWSVTSFNGPASTLAKCLLRWSSRPPSTLCSPLLHRDARRPSNWMCPMPSYTDISRSTSSVNNGLASSTNPCRMPCASSTSPCMVSIKHRAPGSIASPTLSSSSASAPRVLIHCSSFYSGSTTSPTSCCTWTTSSSLALAPSSSRTSSNDYGLSSR